MPNKKIPTDRSLPYPTILGFDHIELFVGNVRQAVSYYQTTWGFQPVASQGFQDNLTDRASILVRQGKVALLLTGATEASSPVAQHLQIHGEGVATVAITVDNVKDAFEGALARGATPVSKPVMTRDDDGEAARAEVKAFNGFTHVFIERSNYRGCFLPGFKAMSSYERPEPMLEELDHVAVAVEGGTLDAWVDFYKGVFGFDLVHEEDIATGQSGMNSKVVQSPSGACKFPLVEPATGRRKSQVQGFLDSHGGPGIQHLAFQTRDIIDTVSRLRSSGVEFLEVPTSYYRDVERRIENLGEDFVRFRDVGILVDHDEWGRLLQVFARSCHDRGTLFFEIIERRGGRGFGGGNIRALFEALEKERTSRDCVSDKQ